MNLHPSFTIYCVYFTLYVQCASVHSLDTGYLVSYHFFRISIYLHYLLCVQTSSFQSLPLNKRRA